MYRTIAEIVFWEFDSIIMQNLTNILPLFCTPTWPSHHDHVSENQEYAHSRHVKLIGLNKKNKMHTRKYMSRKRAVSIFVLVITRFRVQFGINKHE